MLLRKTVSVVLRAYNVEAEVVYSVTEVSRGSNEWKLVGGISELA